MVASAALRRCKHCGKPQDEVVKMMRCSRCASAVYCSKECQTGAWPKHPLTAKLPTLAIMYGFRTADEFRQALRDFIEAHTWAFQSYARAHILLEGGTDYIHTPPKLMEIQLRCLCTPGGTRNPARTFSFVGHRWCTVAEYTSKPIGARNWARLASMREAAHRYYVDDPRFVGMLPMHFTVGDISSAKMNLYPQYRPYAASWRSPSEAAFKGLMEDVLVLCTSSISLGLALRCADGQESIAALPGRFVRSNKLWTWKPLFTDWEQYLAGPRGIPGPHPEMLPYPPR
ncbi:uncharacterized protein TRAVEDRAFT_40379 [Trametes versicolor FP-101664 SS1]|uniref:uncharacterized protein n=1 Tax=Trametes versicolor (strain FP-101664) TaxID=717944 RepID=UPI0004622FBE|nr:uncharacterized protein TRAVEDRAFT_40379 [Trametes versicolor FP-101664 SS1]EIW52726.1 hypothetical protein TRAVEDRAFT_40379 [Trametes versicolor FP-101664 SS1]